MIEIYRKQIINLKKMLLFGIKRTFTIFDPNTLIFQHKKDLDRLQKQITRMGTPAQSEPMVLTDQIDFEPGLEYFKGASMDQGIMLRSIPFHHDEKHQKTVSPEDGFVQFIMPFNKNPKLKASYRLLNTEKIRFGKLLEIFDYLSAMSAYKYNHIIPKAKTATLVTASVDSIALLRDINLAKQLSISAYPTWTGATSMEIRIDLYNGDSDEQNPFERDENFRGSAFFVFVLRDYHDYRKKKKVIPLNVNLMSNANERNKAKLRNEIGNEKKKQRLKNAQESLFKSPPTHEESIILHKQFIFFKNKKMEMIEDESNIKKARFKSIAETRVENSILMQSQNMNINGNIFGGYIMRLAIEIGYTCAYIHSHQESPHLVSVDSVNFHRPVIVGSIAHFYANVCYVQEQLLHVSVECFNYIPGQETPLLTATINITYQTQNASPQVYPSSYECGVKYLEAKRILKKLFDFF